MIEFVLIWGRFLTGRGLWAKEMESEQLQLQVGCAALPGRRRDANGDGDGDADEGKRVQTLIRQSGSRRRRVEASETNRQRTDE